MKMRLSAFLVSLGLWWVAREVPRSEWLLLIGTTGLLAIVMVVLIRQSAFGTPRWQVWGWGLTFRLVILGAIPLWSDDVVRFYWDAWVQYVDISPYAHTPRALLASMPSEAKAIFPQLNSSDYYSVYLPLHQGLFRLALADGVSLPDFIWRLQALYIFLEMLVWAGILYLSTSTQVEKWKWLLWNPILLLEFIGNLHVEGLLVVFLVATYVVYLSTNRVWISIIPFVISVAWKWTPLLWVPLLWTVFRGRDRWRALSVGVFGIVLLTFPVGSHVVTVGQSLDLYFQRFEFNASVYYIVRNTGQWILGYNPIGFVGPALSVLALMSILYWAFVSKRPWYLRAYYSYGVYLALATTVHPWYVLPWLVVGVLAGRSAPWVSLWVMGWSYHAYTLPEQPIWGYALMGCWVLGEEFIWRQRQAPPATRAIGFLHKFFQYLSPNSLAEEVPR